MNGQPDAKKPTNPVTLDNYNSDWMIATTFGYKENVAAYGFSEIGPSKVHALPLGIAGRT